MPTTTIDLSSVFTYTQSTTPIHDGNYPGSQRPAAGGTSTITGTGFGSGPNVVLFDSNSNSDNLVQIPLTGPDIGSYADYNRDTAGTASTQTAIGYDFSGRTWLAGRDPAKTALNDDSYLLGYKWTTASVFDQFFVSYRWVVPTGFHFTNNQAAANQIGGSGSRLKFMWFYEDSITTNPDDIVIPTIPSGSSIQFFGNGVDPQSQAGGRFGLSWVDLSGTDENLFGYYQERNTGTNWDGIVETTQQTNGYFNRVSAVDCKPFEPNAGTPPFAGYKAFYFPGWFGSGGGDISNSQMLFNDVYLAIGPNSRARIMTHDAATLAASSKVYIIPPDTWSDTEITFTPKAYENLTYRSVISADGTLQENV